MSLEEFVDWRRYYLMSARAGGGASRPADVSPAEDAMFRAMLDRIGQASAGGA